MRVLGRILGRVGPKPIAWRVAKALQGKVFGKVLGPLEGRVLVAVRSNWREEF